VSIILPPEIEKPAVIDEIEAPQTHGSFIKEDILYVAGRSNFYSVQVEPDGTLTSLAVNSSVAGTDVIVLGDYAFVAAGSLGEQQLALIEVSDPEDLSTVFFADCEGPPTSLNYWGDYLYLGEGGAGVEVFDIADPEDPVSLGLIPVYRDTEMVSAFRDRLFIADHTYGLLVYDIEDPDDPVYPNNFYDVASPERQVYSINVSGDYVYACMEGYVHILSTENIRQWETADTASSDFGSAVGWFDFPSCCSNVQVEGDFFYAVTFGGGLEIYSIQNPEDPLKLYDGGSGFFTTANHYSLEVQGNRLFANNHYELYTVSIMEE